MAALDGELDARDLHVGTVPPVVISAQPESVVTTVGTPATFTVGTQGGGAPAYTWTEATGFGAPWTLAAGTFEPGSRFMPGRGTVRVFELRPGAAGSAATVTRALPADTRRYVALEGFFAAGAASTLGIADDRGPLAGVRTTPGDGYYHVFGASDQPTAAPVGGGLRLVFDLVQGLLVTQQEGGAEITGTFPIGPVAPRQGELRLYASVAGAQADLGIAALVARDEKADHVRADDPDAPQYWDGLPLDGSDGGFASIAGAPRADTLAVTPVDPTIRYFSCYVQGVDDLGTFSAPASLEASWPYPEIVAPDTICGGATAHAEVLGAAGGVVTWTIGDGLYNPIGEILSVSADGRAIDFRIAADVPLYGSAVVRADVAHAGLSYEATRYVAVLSVASAVIVTPRPDICALDATWASVPDSGNVTYDWTVTNGVIQSGQGTRTVYFQAGATGSAGLGVSISGDQCGVSSTTSIAIHAVPVAQIDAPASVAPGATGLVASVPDAGPGAIYSWGIINGTITSGLGTRSVLFKAGLSGNVGLTVTVLLGQCRATGNATVVIGAANAPPVAADDAYATAEDIALNIPAPGVLGNDTDAEGNTLTAALVTGPAHGTLILGTDGSFLYTPAANFAGPDGFSYRASDGTATSNVAAVFILVTPVNDPPVAADDAYTTAEETALTIPAPGVLGNDTDAEGNTLTAALVTGPAHGTLILGTDGSFVYAPASNFNGEDSFTYRVDDGTDGANPAMVLILVTPVNDAPVASPDRYATSAGTALAIAAPGILANDTDVEGGALGAALLTAPANGTLGLDAQGGFTYVPAAGFTGTDTFTYAARDPQGALSAPATVTLVVTPSSGTIPVTIRVLPETINLGSHGRFLTVRLTAAPGAPLDLRELAPESLRLLLRYDGAVAPIADVEVPRAGPPAAVQGARGAKIVVHFDRREVQRRIRDAGFVPGHVATFVLVGSTRGGAGVRGSDSNRIVLSGDGSEDERDPN